MHRDEGEEGVQAVSEPVSFWEIFSDGAEITPPRLIMTDMTMTTSLAEVVLAADTAVAVTEEVSPEVLMAEVSAVAAPVEAVAVSADRNQKTIK